MSDERGSPEWTARQWRAIARGAVMGPLPRQLAIGWRLMVVDDDGEQFTDEMQEAAAQLLGRVAPAHPAAHLVAPGDFAWALYELALKCDQTNLCALALAFPEAAVCVHIWRALGPEPIGAIATVRDSSSSPAGTPSDEDQVTGGE